MILNIGAIKYCLEQYKSHATDILINLESPL